MLPLHLRSRFATPGQHAVSASEHLVQWDAKKTALIICDVWDHHWCASAESRVVELVPAISGLVSQLRSHGVLIIHAPSTVTSFYQDTQPRSIAKSAPFSATPVPLTNTPRWGTMWYWADGKREGVLPIDDSDDGCDCDGKKCNNASPWTRQNAGIDVAAGDAVSDDGQEVWNVLKDRGIGNVLICGVHLNMCVLGRAFGIRQLISLGLKVALIRDLTDVMYNPQRPPGVDHFHAIDLVVEHVERYLCATVLSTDLTHKPHFRFKHDTRAHIFNSNSSTAAALSSTSSSSSTSTSHTVPLLAVVPAVAVSSLR